MATLSYLSTFIPFWIFQSSATKPYEKQSKYFRSLNFIVKSLVTTSEFDFFFPPNFLEGQTKRAKARIGDIEMGKREQTWWLNRISFVEDELIVGHCWDWKKAYLRKWGFCLSRSRVHHPNPIFFSFLFFSFFSLIDPKPILLSFSRLSLTVLVVLILCGSQWCRFWVCCRFQSV